MTMRDKTPRHCTPDTVCDDCDGPSYAGKMWCFCHKCEGCKCDACLDGVEQRCEDFAPIRDTDRIDLKFVDVNGSQVRVHESSAAMRHCIRIFFDYDEEVFTSGQPGLHLCRGMMAELRDTLDRILKERPVEPGPLACEDRVTPQESGESIPARPATD